MCLATSGRRYHTIWWWEWDGFPWFSWTTWSYSRELEDLFFPPRVLLCSQWCRGPVKQRAILLSVSDAETYKLICSLVSLQALSEFTFKDLVARVTEHYDTKKSTAVHLLSSTAAFHNPGEMASTYIAKLKKLTINCGFEGDVLTDMLENRLVCGINHANSAPPALARETQLWHSLQTRLISWPEYKSATLISWYTSFGGYQASYTEQRPVSL